MELEIHLMNLETVLDHFQNPETPLAVIQDDLKKLVQAVKYLLETNSLNKETLN